MTMKHAVSMVILLAGLAPGLSWGGSIGEPAPPLLVKEWIKGGPLEIKAGSNIFVVAIWTTTSSVSRASIINLNDIQKRFRTNGVVVVGLSDEPAEIIKEFTQNVATNIDYAIAADNQRRTVMSYMIPIRQQGVPYAFVVGTDGNLLWHGHPQRDLKQVLEQVTTGRYDMDQAIKSDVARRQMSQYLALARKNDSRTGAAGQRLLAFRTNDVVLLCDLSFQIATDAQISKRDFALAGEALNQAEKIAPTNEVRVLFTRAVCMFESGKRDEGLAQARQALGFAQSESEKASIQAYLRAIESRQAPTTTNPSSTNRSKDPAAKP
jgi:hypothetical protein